MMAVVTCGKGGILLMVDRKQRAREEWTRDKILPRTFPSGLLPGERSHLLKFAQDPKIAL
jgi:hypothetical protein